MLFGPGPDSRYGSDSHDGSDKRGGSDNRQGAHSPEDAPVPQDPHTLDEAEGAPAEVADAPPGPAAVYGPAAAPDDGHAADQQLLESLAAEMDAVDAALVRLDNGSFDRCEVCGAEIGHDRLVADPLLTRCPAHN